MEIPEHVKQKIQELAYKKGYTVEDLVEYYLEIYNDEWIQSLPDEIKADQALKILISRVVTRPPVKKYDIIPIGYSPLNKNGDRSTLYAFVKGKSGIQRILCRDKHAKIWEFVDVFTLYHVKLETFTDGTLATDPRTKWDDKEVLEIEPKKLLEKIPTVTISEAANHKSAVSSTGFVVDTDWRCVKGLITRRNIARDGRIAVYTIWDETLPYDEIVLPDGTVVPPGMTVWCNPKMAKWAVDSECEFYGDIRVDDNGLPYMNAYLVLPVYGIEVIEDES